MVEAWRFQVRRSSDVAAAFVPIPSQIFCRFGPPVSTLQSYNYTIGLFSAYKYFFLNLELAQCLSTDFCIILEMVHAFIKRAVEKKYAELYISILQTLAAQSN